MGLLMPLPRELVELKWAQTRSPELNRAQTRSQELSPGPLCRIFHADPEDDDERRCSWRSLKGFWGFLGGLFSCNAFA
eukprot:15452274-Alexandrium_andersonii.AAC.1